MKTKVNELSPNAYARIAGVLYLVITVAAIFAHFVIPEQFIVPGDAAATAANITSSETLFRIGLIGSELVVLLSEVVLSVVLYYLLKPVSKPLSLLAAVSRLSYDHYSRSESAELLLRFATPVGRGLPDRL